MNERTREEILDSARQMVADAQVHQEVIEQYFPELKESKSESIRRALISVLKSDFEEDTTIYDISVGDIIAWLEKQDKPNTFSKPQTPIKDTIEVTSRMSHISDSMKPIAEFIMDYAHWDLHKDDWNRPTITVPLFRVLDALIQRGNPYGCDKWWEKPQGKSALEAIKEKKIDNSTKITSKPKFKIGDWVTDGNSVFHITNIDYGFYQYEDGYSVISLIDAKCHLWTIKDAKDGDILVSCVNNRPFIFKGFLDPDHPNCPVAYCGINDAYNFHISRTDWWWEDENVQPASKARRGFLFREMNKAGYKWDADKKELIKL